MLATNLWIALHQNYVLDKFLLSAMDVEFLVEICPVHSFDAVGENMCYRLVVGTLVKNSNLTFNTFNIKQPTFVEISNKIV